MSNYDYSQNMMLKFMLSIPDNKGGSQVFMTFEKALENIKILDMLIPGLTKIIYLVGWQYNGHDDKYPAFFEVNDNLKRAQDRDAKSSLIWLMREARKYNAIVSLHINLADAYPSSPLWQEYIDNDLILLDSASKPKVTGVWNGRKAYQVRLWQEYDSGYFQKRADKLLEMFPLQEQGTIHIDAFFVRKGKDTAIAQEKLARRKMVEYFKEKGIDVTTEFIYRERNNGMKFHFGKSDDITLFDAYWNPVFSCKDILSYSASEVAGGKQCNALAMDKSLHYLIYGNMQGEMLIKENAEWYEPFVREFITYTLPHYYLNSHKRLAVKGIGAFRKLIHSDNVVSYIKDKKIVHNGNIIKYKDDVCMPALWQKGLYFAFSASQGKKKWYIDADKIKLFELKKDKWQEKGCYEVKDNVLELDCEANKAYMIKISD